MRVTKEYEERRNEILDVAESLFQTKGYEKCTVKDILKAVAIAKGTFYYYFKSKEEVLDAVVQRYADLVSSRANGILVKTDLTPAEKLLRAFMAMQVQEEAGQHVLDELHKAENALLHQKTLNQMVTPMVPVLVKIIEEGIAKKVWRCRYPVQYMQIFLAAALTLTDERTFDFDHDGQLKIMAALISLLETMLEVPEDSFRQLYMEHFT